MSGFFSPAVSVMDKLRYPHKFLLLSLPVLLALVAMLAALIHDLNGAALTAEHEVAGLRAVKAANQLVQNMQQHRGLSAGVLGGNEGMRAMRAEKEKAVDASMQALDVTMAPTMRSRSEWAAIRSDWDKIRSDGLKLTAPENIKAHTKLIVQTLELMVLVADDSELTLDPVIDTHYVMDSVVLKMPAVLERLGLLRARGTGALTRKELAAQGKTDLGGILAELANAMTTQGSNLKKVAAYSPALRASLEAPVQAYTAEVEKLTTLIREDILTERFQTNPQAYFGQATTVIDAGYRLIYEVMIPQFETQLAARANAARRTLWLELGIAISVVLLITYLAIGMYQSVAYSVAAYAQGAKRLAGGDLTTRFDLKGRDELHQAAHHFNDMADALRQLLSRVQGNVQQLRQVADGLAASSQQISRGAGMQSESASSMAAAVEEMTVGVDHIANSAQNAKEYSHQSDTKADQGGRIVGQVVAEIQLIADTVNESASAVEDLGRQSDQISAIVGTIKEIADQTNLLALNAAIEAARAGESGRGFAVVADEVRKLAERTTRSTQEIAQMIASIQAGTANAVSSMKTGVSRVAEGVEQAREAGLVIGEVQDQSRQVATAVDDISIALREQATASTDIAKNVERIARMAEENNSAATGNAQTANELKRLSESLSAEVGKFKT